MKKCDVCGKSISDFSTICPYCNSNLTTDNQEVHAAKREAIKTKNLLNRSIILHIVLTWFFSVAYSLIVKYAMPSAVIIGNASAIIVDVLLLANCVRMIIKYPVFKQKKNAPWIVLSSVLGIFPLARVLLDIYKYGGGYYLILGMDSYYTLLTIGLIKNLVSGLIVFCLSMEFIYIIRNRTTERKNETV